MYTVRRIEVTLTVPSIEETAAWYERVLGWTSHSDASDPQGRCIFGSVSRASGLADGEGTFTGFNLSRASAEDAPATSESRGAVSPWIFVDDVDDVHARAVEGGAQPDAPPENRPWGGRTFVLRDVNGVRLTFVEMVAPASEC